ncbi:hypothetical protein P9112_001717 [Eukaryota sp. TZLM1-RC]
MIASRLPCLFAMLILAAFAELSQVKIINNGEKTMTQTYRETNGHWEQTGLVTLHPGWSTIVSASGSNNLVGYDHSRALIAFGESCWVYGLCHCSPCKLVGPKSWEVRCICQEY